MVSDPESPALWTTPKNRPFVLLVRGQRGIYAWQGDRFAAATAGQVPPTEADRLDAEKLPVGAFGLRAVLSKPGAGVVFQHEYQPRRAKERAMQLAGMGATVLRPPLSALPSLFASPKRVAVPGPRQLLDPGVTLGLRGPLVVNVLLALALAALTFVRLGRLGCPGWRRWFWTVAVVMLGPVGYLCQRLVETARAWRPMPAEAVGPQVGPLLLEPATATGDATA